jgi:hypothetical protein
VKQDGLIEYLNGVGAEKKHAEILKRFAYGTFIGQKYNFLYVETPKCACSSMKKIVARLEGFEIEEMQVGEESSPKMSIHKRKYHPLVSLNNFSRENIKKIMHDDLYVRFCVVRNPYARLASAWSDKIRQMEPTHLQVIEEIQDYHNISDQFQTPSFEEFVLWVVNRDENLECDAHWESMLNLLLPDLIHYTDVLKTESLEDDFQVVLRKLGVEEAAKEILECSKTNESLPVEWKSLYSENTARLVFEHFKDDFTHYNYDKDSWKNQTTHLDENDVNILRKKLSKLDNTAIDAVVNRNRVISSLLAKVKVLEEENNNFVKKIMKKLKRLI